MLKRFRIIRLVILSLIFVIDGFLFFEIRSFFNIEGILFSMLFWLIPLFFLFFLFLFSPGKDWVHQYQKKQRELFLFFGAFILIYLPKLIFSGFLIIQEVIELSLALISSYYYSVAIISYIGLGLALFLFFALLYGVLFGKYHFKVDHVPLTFERLPEEWNGLRIVQISDLHIGSWSKKKTHLEKVVRLINKEKPDLIFFTGDLVNNLAEEIYDFIPVLKNLEASTGKYSILGNHDYGDYFPWSDNKEKQKNLRRLKEVHQEIGFRLLLNESLILNGKNSKIGVIGVENWGLPPFHKYGDLERAFSHLNEQTKFNILLSHDPSHWKEEVINYKQVDLTLSGHTHGMQFGIFFNGIKWSPAKLKYPEWGGVYEKKGKKLYVNTGLGFIGFPGRVGIRPKITVIDLYNSAKSW
ncbi:MAG: metallophosphoesterase [Bacteroidota bacterium]